jgi:hypothetical protein
MFVQLKILVLLKPKKNIFRDDRSAGNLQFRSFQTKLTIFRLRASNIFIFTVRNNDEINPVSNHSNNQTV